MVDFIKHILQSTDYADFRRLKDRAMNNKRKNLKIYNVCDAEADDFKMFEDLANDLLVLDKRNNFHTVSPCH